ncbi:MAG: hypothetical protein R3B40_16785 [Polyangiales bacterium]|nr:hypothetical protein [Myxococcales bacterium]MCB9659687.1 hypothetical protein [Sandaracinaceae bacterium]
MFGLAALTVGCGGGQVCGVAGSPACPKVFTLTHLPELVRFVTFGETRPEDVQSRFQADHLHVVSSGGRDLRVQAEGPNRGRRYVYVDVTRRTEGGPPLGALGDDFALRFEFTSFEDDDGPMLLYGVQVTQPRTATDVCAPARELAAADGLDGCHEHSAHPTAAPDEEGWFRACVTDEEDRLVEVACVAPASDTRRLHVAFALGPPGTDG